MTSKALEGDDCPGYVAGHPDVFIELRSFDANPVFQHTLENEPTAPEPVTIPDKDPSPPLDVSLVSPLPGLLGILYYDRVRYRYAGVVRGEHINTIPVTPGEEVNLYQRSESRLKSSFEKTVDAESEAEFSFSSVWSTDIGLETQDSVSGTIGGNLGVNLGPIDVVNIGGSAGASGGSTVQTSETRQIRNAHQLTSELNRRLRLAHKTVVSTSSDRLNQTGISRRLVNDNPDRTINYRVRKLYNKRRLSLERYEARLALNLYFTNPFMSLLVDIRDRLMAMNPYAPENYDCQSVQGTTVEQAEQTFTFADAQLSIPEPGPVFDVNALQTQKITVTPPLDLNLWSAQVEVTGYKEKVVRSNGSIAVVDRSPDVFFQHFGRVGVEPADNKMWGSPGLRNVVIEVQRGMSAFAALRIAGSWWGSEVTVRVRLRFEPAVEQDLALEECRMAERARLEQELSFDTVDASLRSALGQRRAVLIDLARAYVLQAANDAGGSTLEGREINRLLNLFDWDGTVVDLQEAGHGQVLWSLVHEIRALVRTLFPGIDVSEALQSLATAGAQVFVPLKPGSEDLALALLSSIDRASPFLEEFQAMRNERFGPVSESVATFEEILAPGPLECTEEDADQWANPWEAPRTRFEVLDVWADTTPTDGIHVEPVLSTCGSADDYRIAEVRVRLEDDAGSGIS
ncbi:MAG: hypothetical protein Tsb0019_15700 [Roseibium sp.]